MASALALAGPLIGAAGSIFGGSTAQSAANTGAGQSLTGYNYLNTNPVNAQAQGAGATALTSQGNTQSAIAQLLGEPRQIFLKAHWQHLDWRDRYHSATDRTRA